ncbi:MAG: nuclear transport factor 2 family protein [Acidobacteria bacterium]|nr:nuclear transport factor 2 family protein [Acidobacteriota bacterium]
MRSRRIISFALVLLLACMVLNAQESEDSELFKTLQTKDDLLFNFGFNKCEIKQFEKLVSEDFEFYHDRSGVTATKAEFLISIKDGLCKLSYKPRRELVIGSMEVYPLSNNGDLYGAIQTGRHRFYAMEKDKPEYFTSIARFIHIWKLENGEWKFIRGFSYDHQNADSK